MSSKQSPSTIKRLAAFIGMVIGTGVVGIVAAFLAALVGAFLLRGELFGVGALAGVLLGIIVGYPVGVIIGVILINKVLHRQGSLVLSILGVIIGGVAVIGLTQLLNLNLNPSLLLGLFFLLVPLLGTVGFRLNLPIK